MASLAEILADRAKYADDQSFTGPDGVKTTVGELRNQFMPKSDYTKETQRWSEEKQQLERDYGQRLQATSYQLQQMQQEMARRGAPPVRDRDDLDIYRNDPAWAPVVKKMDAMFDIVEKQNKALEQANRRLVEHEQAWWLNHHAQTLKEIQRRDPEFVDNNKVKELLAHAQQHGIANLDFAYRDLVRDRDLKKAAEDAEKRGYEKAKTETSSPHIPTGGKATTVTAPGTAGQWQPDPNTADTHSMFNQAEEAARVDDPAELERIGAQFAANWGGR